MRPAYESTNKESFRFQNLEFHSKNSACWYCFKFGCMFQHIHRYKSATLVWHYVIHISGLWCSITSYINSNTTMSLETVQMRVQIWGLHAAQRWTTSVPTAWGNKLFRNMHILSKGVFLQRATARHLPSIPFTSGAVMKSSINPSVRF